jgi:hypothetical protein
MTTLVGLCIAAAFAVSAIGLYDLQLRLERWDYDRHFDD